MFPGGPAILRGSLQGVWEIPSLRERTLSVHLCRTDLLATGGNLYALLVSVAKEKSQSKQDTGLAGSYLHSSLASIN